MNKKTTTYPLFRGIKMGKNLQVLQKNWFSILDHLDEIFLFIGKRRSFTPTAPIPA
jgi:hypothetical protein